MSFGAVIGAVGAVAGGAIAARGAKKAAQTGQQAELELAQISREEWDLYKSEAIPMLRELSGMRSPTTVEEEQALAAQDVKGAFGAARQQTMRALAQTRNPGDQATSAILGRSYMDEAGAVSRALTDARRMVDERDWSRTLQAISAYQKLPTDATTSLTNAARLSQANADRVSRAATQGAYGASRLALDVWESAKKAGYGNEAGAGGYPDYGVGNEEYMGGGYSQANDYANSLGGLNFKHGGKVRGPGTGTSDSVPALVDGRKPVRLSSGEFVIPADVVRKKGQEFFEKLLQKYHRPVAQQDESMMANGGALKKRGLPADVEEAIFQSIPRRALSRSARR